MSDLPVLSPTPYEDPRLELATRSVRGAFWCLRNRARREGASGVAYLPGMDAARTVGFLCRQVGETDFDATGAALLSDLERLKLARRDDEANAICLPPELSLEVPVRHEARAVAEHAPAAVRDAPQPRRQKPVDRVVNGLRCNRNTLRAAESMFDRRVGVYEVVPEGVTWPEYLSTAAGAAWLSRVAAKHAATHPLAELSPPTVEAPSASSKPAQPVEAPRAPSPASSKPAQPVEAPRAPSKPAPSGRSIEPGELFPLLLDRVRKNRAMRSKIINVGDASALRGLGVVLLDWSKRNGWGRETYEVWADYIEAGGMDWRNAEFSASNVVSKPGHFETEVTKALRWHADGRGSVVVNTAPARTGRVPRGAAALASADHFTDDPMTGTR